MYNKTKGMGRKEQQQLELKTNHILAIAIDKYSHQTPLHNPVDDCQKIIEVLCTRYRFEAKYVKEIYNEAATRSNIINALYAYRKLSENDNLLILFSGHGHYDKEGDEGYWIPIDGKGIADYVTIHDIKTQVKAYRAHHVAMIIDSCFSGAMTRNVIDPPDKKDYLAALRAYKKKSRWAMTSGRVELVYDGNKGRNSPFVRGLLSELRTNGKGMLLFSELGVAVRNITNRNADQDPSCSYLREVNDMNGEFSFILKNYQPTEIEIKKEADNSKVATTIETDISPIKETINRTPPIPQGIIAIKKQLRQWMVQGELKKAFQFLFDKMKEDSSHKSTVYIRMAGLNGLEKDKANGVAMNVPQRTAQIHQALLYVIDHISDEDF